MGGGFAGVMLACLVFFTGACTTPAGEGRPLPTMTFEHMPPFLVRTGSIDVENRYDLASDPDDASASFQTPPGEALQRYAARRLQAAGGEGVLKFVIEDASVHRSLEQSGENITEWMGVDRKDVYDVTLKIRLYEVLGNGRHGADSVMNMRRSISIPQRYSLAKKEQEQLTFLEELMKDVDKAVTEVLGQKMGLGAGSP